jgi:predicted double-glycine peptidase
MCNCIIIGAIGGCATTGKAALIGALPVPLVRQATRYSCGAAALLGVLYYWQKYDGNESSLYRDLGTTEADGTEPAAIARVAHDRFGLAARYRRDVTLADLAAALGRGETVIVDLQAWAGAPRDWRGDWDDGHYVVLVALDGRRAYFMDPSTAGGYAFIGREELERRWHDVEGHGAATQKVQHMAIFIAGRDHLRSYPAPAAEMR